MASCEPALRDDLPACWSADARSIASAFRFGHSVRPWNWLELGAADAEKLWALLAAFVVYFNRRYGERPDRRIPPCWAEHGPLVEELTTLVFARWQAFESVHGSVGGAQYWHHYSLPAFYQRLRDWLGDDLLACQQGRHRSREDPPLDLTDSWSTRTETIAMLDVTYRDAPSASARRRDAFDREVSRSPSSTRQTSRSTRSNPEEERRDDPASHQTRSLDRTGSVRHDVWRTLRVRRD